MEILGEILEEISEDTFDDRESERLKDDVELILTKGTISEELSQKIKEKVDEEIEADVKISSISPGRIMVKSMESLVGETNWNDEMKSFYTMLRIVFWILYLSVLMILIVTILSFCLEWTKYIALGISSFYGLAAAVVFGIGQFLTPGAAAERMYVEDAMKSLGSEVLSCFMGVAFLIAFIIAVLLLIVSVVSMFVGNAEREVVVPDPDPEEEWRRRERERQERERQERERRERERKERERQQQAQKPVMGQVRCTKGIAMGQGFSLPQESKVVVGKSRQNANLLIQDPHVSNIHCSIRYQAATNSYIVKDHSSNGTFVNGVRLQKDVPMVFPAGTVLQLADGSNEITLG